MVGYNLTLIGGVRGMVTLTTMLETEAVYSEDMKKRYELTKRFKREKGKSILVIMMNPSAQDIKKTDNTTNLLLNHLCIDGDEYYTTVTIWNLFADICNKLCPKRLEGNDDNMEYMEMLLKRDFDNILIGWGNTFEGNKIVMNEKSRLNHKLEKYKDRLVHIVDPKGEISCSPIHPLFAGQRLREWKLEPYQFPENPVNKDDNDIIQSEVNDDGHDYKRQQAIRKMKERIDMFDKRQDRGEHN